MGHLLSSHKKAALLEHDETALRNRLLEALPRAARNGAEIFINSHFNRFELQRAHLGSLPNLLLRLAQSCVALRAELQLPAEGSVGDLFLAACEARNSEEPHGLGPRRLAEQLHAALMHSAGVAI